jgi:2-oxoglutarate dehydrogenase E2 component (dihydrolipoamide succinyltransferase)
VRAAVNAINQYPIVNAVIDGNDVIHKNYIDISVAIATPNGLMVPVIRNAHLLKNHEI